MKTKKENNKYIEWILLIILFCGLMYLTANLEFTQNLKPETQTDKILMYIGIFIMVHIVILAHELGHIVTGLVQGFKLELLVVGLLGIKREDRKVKVYLNKNLGFYGGVASTSPMDEVDDLPTKFGRILLAGPIASILFAIICLVACFFVGKPYGIILYAGCITSIGMFLGTTIPSKTGMFFTDRKRYQRLTTPGRDQQTELAMLNIMTHFLKDDSYQNVEKDDIETLISDETPSVNFYGLFYMICWQLEHQGKVDENLKKQYEYASNSIPKNLVKVLNKEIENYRQELSKG